MATSTSSSLYSTCFSSREYFSLCVSSSITFIMPPKSGLAMPFIKTAIRSDSVLFKFLALLFGTKSYSFITLSTLLLVSGLISGWLLSALETVLTPTPHSLAISLIVNSDIPLSSPLLFASCHRNTSHLSAICHTALSFL